MPSKKEIDNAIKTAIDKGNINYLREKVSADQIKRFTVPDLGMGAFLYACHNATFETVKFITDTMIEHFKNSTYDNVAEEDIEEIREGEYEKFFYERGFSTTENGKAHSAASLLLNKGETGYKIFEYTNQFLHFFEYDELLREITTPRQGTWNGYVKDKIKHRDIRGFPAERERQLLKQFSTILFFNISEKLEKEDERHLTEVQTMHLRLGNNSYLFVAGNKSFVTNQFDTEINDFSELSQVLTKKRIIKGDAEGHKRVKRYAKNFKEIIYGDKVDYKYNKENEEESNDYKEFQKIRELLCDQDGVIRLLKLNYSKQIIEAESIKSIEAILKKGGSELVFVNTSSCVGKFTIRHAEEFLVDIANIAAKIAQEKNKSFHACIAGKKRPCITCFGRMTAFNKSSAYKIKFGQYPGLIWSDVLKLQDVPSAEESIKTLALVGSYATYNKENEEKTEYDSGTDDEQDNKYRLIK